MKIAVRVDSATVIGSGHVMRSLTLAELLRERGHEVYFVSRDLPGNITSLIQEHGFRSFSLPRPSIDLDHSEKFGYKGWLGVEQETDVSDTSKVLKDIGPLEWLIVDHYALDSKWEREMRKFTDKICVIDDLANRSHECDLLLDQNLIKDYQSRYDQKVPKGCVKLLGPIYAILRSEFLKVRGKRKQCTGQIKRVLIFFGGSDVTNETEKTLKALNNPDMSELIVDVVLGKSNKHIDNITNLCRRMNNVSLHVQANNMAELMRNADLAIGAGGTTVWERFCVGLPAMITTVAENQQAIIDFLQEEELIYYCGKASSVTEDKILLALCHLLSQPLLIKKMAEQIQQVVDGRGCERVVEAMERLSVR